MSGLRDLPDDELLRQYDQAAEQTGNSLHRCQIELSRRDAERMCGRTERMYGLTKTVMWLTAVVTTATILNMVAAIVLVLSSLGNMD